MRREIFEALRDILIIIALAISAFLWGMQRGEKNQDAMWGQTLKQTLAEYQCVKK